MGLITVNHEEKRRALVLIKPGAVTESPSSLLSFTGKMECNSFVNMLAKDVFTLGV